MKRFWLLHLPCVVLGLLFLAGVFRPFMKTIELIGALCLLTNRAPALKLAILSPLLTVIVLFHVFLNPQGIPLAVVLLVCSVLLYIAYASRYASLVAPGNP